MDGELQILEDEVRIRATIRTLLLLMLAGCMPRTTVINTAPPSVIEHEIYGAGGTMVVSGVIQADAARDFIAGFDDFSSHHVRNATVYISSPGGDVDSGIAMIEAMKLFKVHTTCIVTGEAYSMALFLLEYCDERKATAGSRLMVHHTYLSVDAVTADGLRDTAERMDVREGPLFEHLAQRTGLSVAKINERVGAKQWWMNPTEALSAGVIDAVSQ